MASTTINYWEDDWEQQVAQTQAKEEETKVVIEIDSWEDLDDDEPLKVVEKPKIQASVWNTHTHTACKTNEYKNDFPSMNTDAKKEKDDERARVERLKAKSVHNIFEAFNDDEAGVPSKPVAKVSRNPQPRFEREPKKDRPKPRAPRKSRFCRDGANCKRHDCWWAHSERELVPDRCNRGLNCRCIIIDYNKEIHNNPRSRSICMYRHDESISSYLKRTGQNPPVVSVENRFSRQAQEMARVTGNTIKVE